MKNFGLPWRYDQRMMLDYFATGTSRGQVQDESAAPSLYLLAVIDYRRSILQMMNSTSDVLHVTPSGRLELLTPGDRLVLFSVSQFQHAMEDKRDVAMPIEVLIRDQPPFIFIVLYDHTWAETKERLRRKMAIPQSIFRNWSVVLCKMATATLAVSNGFNSKVTVPLLDHEKMGIYITATPSHFLFVNPRARIGCAYTDVARRSTYYPYASFHYLKCARAVVLLWPMAPLHVQVAIAEYMSSEDGALEFLTYAERVSIQQHARHRPIRRSDTMYRLATGDLQ